MAEAAKKEVEKTVDPLTPVHKGFGRYEVDGQLFQSKAEAERYVAAQKAQAEEDLEIGDIVPEGFDMKIYETSPYYRGSPMELAMNEVYTPNGGHNRFYDREWIWAWAAHRGTDIADKRAKGYQLVTLPELEKGIKEDRYPEHILSLVREEGSYLVYGDSVLMRMPRVLWRQRKREQLERNMRFFKDLDTKQRAQFDNAGVGIGKQPMTNELQIRL
jgi:hypothetical protein